MDKEAINERYKVSTHIETGEYKILLIGNFKEVQFPELKQISEANGMPIEETSICAMGWIAKNLPDGDIDIILLNDKEYPKAVLRWEKQ